MVEGEGEGGSDESGVEVSGRRLWLIRGPKTDLIRRSQEMSKSTRLPRTLNLCSDAACSSSNRSSVKHESWKAHSPTLTRRSKVSNPLDLRSKSRVVGGFFLPSLSWSKFERERN